MDELQYYNDTAQPPKNNRKALKYVIIAAVVIGLLIFIFPPLYLHTTSLKLYPAYRAITSIHRNIREPDWFSDFAEDVENDFAFDYMPSMMQGTGHYSVRFRTSPEKAREYAERFAEQARYEFLLSQYSDSAWTSVRDLGYDAPENKDSILIFRDTDFWSGHEETAKVYVIDAVLDWNHPHSSAIIVDEEAGMVELSQLG